MHLFKDAGTKEKINNINLKKAIKGNDIILLLVPNGVYSDRIKKITKAISEENERICYVTINKPYNTILKTLEKARVETKKIFFIDAVTKKVKEEKSSEQVIYVSSPKALTEMNIAIKKVMESGNTDVTLFDAISTLLVYDSPASVVRFVHSLISSFRTIGSKGVMVSLKEDSKGELIKDLNMFVDKVLEIN